MGLHSFFQYEILLSIAYTLIHHWARIFHGSWLAHSDIFLEVLAKLMQSFQRTR